MEMSAKGRERLKGFEGCELMAYRDGGGVWTIGVGHTKGVKAGDKISQFEADELLDQDLQDHDITPLLDDCPTRQCEYDAMMSLAFNIGLENFRHSTVLKRHKLGNKMGAANAFLLWVYDGGKRVQGLVNRREAERKIYLGAS